jgi:hypothetical protein
VPPQSPPPGLEAPHSPLGSGRRLRSQLSGLPPLLGLGVGAVSDSSSPMGTARPSG